MKTLKYILILILVLGTFHSCLVDDETRYDLNSSGPNLVTFERLAMNAPGLANGDEYTFKFKIKLVGPTIADIKNDITVTVSADAASTATDGVHYRIDNPSIVLSPDNNFLGLLEVTLVTEGNTPPMEGTPEYDDYVAPVLVLNITATGDPKVIGSGKSGTITLNYTPPNPYAGDYTSHVIYLHPSMGTYPDNIYVEDDYDKTLAPVTGRKCETLFGIWDTDYCWITINADNSIRFDVADSWPYSVSLGDPYDATKVSHYDPATGIIYLYYHYEGAGGFRIFWETLTPKE